MELTHHIKQLLFQHDCVIMPQLGGFVCSHKKLEFNIHTGLITPARKTIAFNQSLNNNDGLLANYIAQKEKVGYTKALENINAWVSSLHHRLQEGQTVNLEGLGSFSLNEDKRVVFVPFADANFSMDTYGLGTVDLGKKVKATKAEKKAKPTVVLAEPATTPQPEKQESIEKQTTEAAASIPPPRKRRKPSLLRRIGAVVFTLVVFFAMFILQDYAFHARMDKGSIINFEQAEPHGIPADIGTDEVLEEKGSDESSTFENADIIDTDNDEAANSLENNTITQERVETSTTKTAKTDSVFYIIAGAFSSKSNAQNLVNDLTDNGFSPEIIKTDNSSLYRVGYQRYATRNEAESKLTTVRSKTQNSAAWVLAVKP